MIKALENRSYWLADNVVTVFRYLDSLFIDAMVVDPANTNNIISEDLTQNEKLCIKEEAMLALSEQYWGEIVK